MTLDILVAGGCLVLLSVGADLVAGTTREREAYCRHETLRKLADSQGTSRTRRLPGIVDRNDPDPAYLVGVIPMLVGATSLFYA